MNNDIRLNESIATVRNLMHRLGENLILNEAETILPVPKKNRIYKTLAELSSKPLQLNKPLTVVVQPSITKNKDGKNRQKSVYVNILINELVNSCTKECVKSILIAVKRLIDGYGQIPDKSLKTKEGDYQISIMMSKKNNVDVEKGQDDFGEVINNLYRFFSTISYNPKGVFSISPETIIKSIKTISKNTMLDTESQSGKDALSYIVLKAAQLWKELMTKSGGNIESFTPAFGKTNFLTPNDVKGHQLSVRNQLMVYVQSQLYGNSQPPKFVCTPTLASNLGRTIVDFSKPYYVLVPLERLANKRDLYAMAGKDAEVIKMNPQIEHELRIIYGTHDLKGYRWVEYYDIEEASIVSDDKDDLFNTTAGFSNNMTGEINKPGEELKDKLALRGDDYAATSNDSEVVNSNNVKTLFSPEDVKIVFEVFKGACDIMGFPNAYENLGYKKSEDLDVIRQNLSNTVSNLCRLILSERYNIGTKGTGSIFTVTIELVKKMVGLRYSEVNNASVPNCVTSTINDIKNALRKSIAIMRQKQNTNAQTASGDKKMVGEGILSRCLDSILSEGYSKC